MKPYQHIFPEMAVPIMTLSLERSLGGVPKGNYSFIECYCTDPGCDCRRVSLFVVDGKARQKALISFGFDPNLPMAGPFLDPEHRQAPYAEELLDIFVEMVNTELDWLGGMYQRYRAVRKKICGDSYRGKPFPKPGSVVREAAVPALDPGLGPREAIKRMTMAGLLDEGLEADSGDQLSLFADSYGEGKERIAFPDDLREARMTGLSGVPDEDVLAGLCRTIEAMGLSSPFEGIEALLQVFALGNPEMQVELTEKLLRADNPFIRDIAALMLFHPDPKVRVGVARLLAVCDGQKLTAETLRRLIVSRNWLPPTIRKNMDRAIANARKARVECAQLPRHPSMSIHASTIDGVGAQSFHVLIPNGRGFLSCALLLKQGVGVADAFVVPLKNQRELKDFLEAMKKESFFLETSQQYLDARVCQALSEGTHRGNASNFWLVHIAELLGRDQWRAVPFHPRQELEALHEELTRTGPELLNAAEVEAALEDSAGWPTVKAFDSWFEDDGILDREVEASQRKKPQLDPQAAINRVLRSVLEKRRSNWLERLVLAALWLKSSDEPPLPWHRMFHVARVVAEEARPLPEIPLFLSIAERSFAAYLGRSEVR